MKQLLILLLFISTGVKAQNSYGQKRLDSICRERGHVLWLTKKDSIEHMKNRVPVYTYYDGLVDGTDSSYIVRHRYNAILGYPDICYRCHRAIFPDTPAYSYIWIRTIWRRK